MAGMQDPAAAHAPKPLPSRSATKAKLQRWACYFHLRAADALVSQADTAGAVATVERGLEVAKKHGLLVEEVRPFCVQHAVICPNACVHACMRVCVCVCACACVCVCAYV